MISHHAVPHLFAIAWLVVGSVLFTLTIRYEENLADFKRLAFEAKVLEICFFLLLWPLILIPDGDDE